MAEQAALSVLQDGHEPEALAQRQDLRHDWESRIAASNRLQATKVNSLMTSIQKLQKENLLLRKRGHEVNRTGQYKRLQSELGRQDVMIEALRYCIGPAKAQELAANALDALLTRGATRCSSCHTAAPELFRASGALLCKSCYSHRYWQEPPAELRAQLSDVSSLAAFPETKEELEEACNAAELELASAKRALKKAEQSEAPLQRLQSESWAPGLQTAAALSNLLAGYVQRADQLQKENESLDTHRRQLEDTIAQQEQLAKLQLHDQVSALPTTKHGVPAVALEDLQTRLNIKSGEVDRLARVVNELRQRLSFQKDKQDSVLKEEQGIASAFSELQEDMGKWTEATSEEHASHMNKLKQAKEQVVQQLVKGHEQLREAQGKLRKSVQSVHQQKDPLELETRVKAQARRLREALKDFHGSIEPSKFWSKVRAEADEFGLEPQVQAALRRHGYESNEGEASKLEVAALKVDLCALELGSQESQVAGAMIRKWEADREKMQEAFRAEAKEQLAALDRIQSLNTSEHAALEHAKSQAPQLR